MATSTKRGKVEGEGSYTASKNYRKGAEAFAKSGKVKSAARVARKAVEGGEGRELKRAEQAGKKGPRSGGPQMRGPGRGGNGTKARGKVRPSNA